jgi:surfeit locus 1 family protein
MTMMIVPGSDSPLIISNQSGYKEMQFKPSPGLSISLSTIAVACLWLGNWQLERKEEKQILFDQFENAPMLSIEEALQQDKRISRVQAYGRFDDKRHVLLDNKVLNGRAGVHVLTPFKLYNGTTILVNRGWLPLPPDRSYLPPVPTEHSPRTINGILKKPTTDGPRLGKPDELVTEEWPQLVTYLDLETVGEALGTPLSPWLLQLDSADTNGFDGRQWKAAVMGPKVHAAYAFQWFALALATVIIWLTMGILRGKSPQ